MEIIGTATLQPTAAVATVAPATVFIYATFGQRVGAFLLDWLVLTGIGIGIGIVVGVVLPASAAPAAIQLLSIIGVVCYYAGYESSDHQGTLGKQQLGLKVKDLRGNRLTFMDAVFRWLAKLVSLVIFGIGFLFPLWTARKQTLHDLMVGAVVVKGVAE